MGGKIIHSFFCKKNCPGADPYVRARGNPYVHCPGTPSFFQFLHLKGSLPFFSKFYSSWKLRFPIFSCALPGISKNVSSWKERRFLPFTANFSQKKFPKISKNVSSWKLPFFSKFYSSWETHAIQKKEKNFFKKRLDKNQKV